MDLPRATVRVTPGTSVFTGETVTLTCEIETHYRSLDWKYLWDKGRTMNPVFSSDSNIFTISSASDQDEFWCRGERAGRPSSSQDSDHVTLSVKDLPRVTVRVTPDTSVFTGETVTLKCEIEEQYRSLDWRYLWSNWRGKVLKSYHYTVTTNSLTIKATQSVEFCCETHIHGRPKTFSSSYIYLTVKDLPRATVRVTPDTSVFTGETVTLKCEIETHYRSLYWRYQWYKDRTEVLRSEHYTVNTLTISSFTQSSQFWCVTEIHGRPQTSQRSFAVHVTVIDLPRATVRVTPDTSVFTGETVTLKCEIETHHKNWRYLWYKDKTVNQVFSSDSNIFTISSASDQDEFWCRGGRAGRPSSSQDSDHVTLSVKGSKPKAELTSDTEGSVLTGNTVTLTCLMNQFTGWKFYWYKHTQNTEKKTTEGIYYRIHNITVSDGGQFWCRAGRGNPVYYTDYSDVLWINVTDSAASSSSSHGLKVGVAVGLSLMFLIIFLVFLWCYKTRKGKVSESPSGVSPQQNISQTSDQKHNEDGYTSLQSAVTVSGPIDELFSQVDIKKKKQKSKDNVSGAADLTYADIELKPKKEVKKKKEKKDVASGSNDVIYAQIK
ncbi:hypothetical protein E1301_Tti022508 [Triplophysa tibetana]|uniref:Ig-like domain-containing protein n=1 Tax=Triplophysa tibetana TaxID=1572043 RepID=A0A5A9NCF5_9TELE|nr:hypothetical protein E1301_Tti022508 [Triplophysa tibetana]